ncbi:MAG: Holliday junction branch migration protein RuvA [Anaerolineales bacterium]|nr:Holliday junction branch migration protein RuvA [Anaerolineales bacterium]MCB8953178.1 Holliday junction branch migration protein RuvA [Ardenticatenales bacterium]
MIASISGTVQKISKDHLVLRVGGVGLRVFVPRNVLEDVGGAGRSLMLHTHLLVREDALTLFGFQDEEDLSLFEILLGVSGVGPKVALAILSTLSPELLKSAIMREEPAVLQRVPGIGKKTAERLLFQLRDKLDLTAEKAAMPFVSDVDADVIDVLTSLGFSIVEAQTALQNIPREVREMDARVQAALQYLDQR